MTGRHASLGLALAALVAAVVLFAGLAPDDRLHKALTRRGHVAVVGHEMPAASIEATRFTALQDLPALAGALKGDDGAALVAAMQEAGVDGLLVGGASSGQGATLGALLAARAHVPGLRGWYLTSRAALYGVDFTAELDTAERDAMLVVARRLLAGDKPPRITSFPEPLRRVRPVEVMVMLKEGTRPRLWRSARGSSLGRALVTAASVARKRWFEREQAMGGPLGLALPQLTVELSLLMDDGTIGERTPAFIDRVFGPRHGVAYERKGAWRYLLPKATQEAGGGRASKAYAQIFEDDALPPGSLTAPDIRLYRLIVNVLAVSQPKPPRQPDELDVVEPDDVLKPQ